jgi:DNA polymerase-4
VTLKLRDDTFRTVTRSRSLEQPVMSGEELYHVALDLFRRENLHGRKVRLIGVSASGFDAAVQTSLFDTSARKEKVEKVLADIRGRFGKTAITRASLVKKTEKKE